MSDKFNETGVTQIAGTRDSRVTPLMSYTAVTTHSEMASAFVNHIISYCQRLIPDRRLTIEDIMAICHVALERNRQGVTILEGKHLRSRISEQLARSRRYNEPFALIALRLTSSVTDTTYEAVVDLLRERMRRSDAVFMFRNRIMLLLPHTERGPTLMLIDRIQNLMSATFSQSPLDGLHALTFPSRDITRSSQVLDWAEDQLR